MGLDRLSWIGFGTFLVVSCVAGGRLLGLARRTRAMPELLLAISLLCLGPLGYGLTVIGRNLGPARAELATALVIAASSANAVGTLALYIFVWRVFRPDAPWARLAFYTATALLLTAYAGDAANRVLLDLDGSGVTYWMFLSLRMVASTWAAVEAFLYCAKMRRRAALGIGDALAASRFRMWGLASVCAALSYAIWGGARLVTQQSPSTLPEINLAISGLALVTAACLWLTFFPPAGYQRRLRRSNARAISPRTNGCASRVRP